jgi:hypothetical protein
MYYDMNRLQSQIKFSGKRLVLSGLNGQFAGFFGRDDVT